MLNTQDQINRFAHGAMATTLRRTMMRDLFDLVGSIADSDCQTDALHNRNVSEVIADERAFALFQARAAEDFAERSNLVTGVLLDISHSQLARPPLGRARCPPGNNSRLQTRLVAKDNSLPVANMKGFLLVAVWQERDSPVSQNSVAVH